MTIIMIAAEIASKCNLSPEISLFKDIVVHNKAL